MIKNKNNATAALTLALITLPISANAEWTGVVEGGKILDGDSQDTRIELILSNNQRPFSQQITAEWIQANRGSDNFEIAYLPRYWFSDVAYVFGEGSLRTLDSLSLDNYQRALEAGLGIQLVNSATQTLQAEISAIHVTSIMEATPITDELDESVVFTGVELRGSQLISDVLKLELDTDYVTSDNLDTGTAEAGILYRINTGAIKYSYRYQITTIGDADAVSNTNSAVSFLYSF